MMFWTPWFKRVGFYHWETDEHVRLCHDKVAELWEIPKTARKIRFRLRTGGGLYHPTEWLVRFELVHRESLMAYVCCDDAQLAFYGMLFYSEMARLLTLLLDLDNPRSRRTFLVECEWK